MTQYIVVLTGGIGSGKSTVANFFSKLGVPLVDSDIIAREVVEKNSITLQVIAQHFGPGVLEADGSLKRRVLREKIFSDSKKKTWLNNLLHPLIQKRTEKKLRQFHMPYVLWVTPLFVEKNLKKYVNRVLVVDVEKKIQIARTLNRDTVSYKQVESILNAQASRCLRLACADDIIDNSGHPKEIIDRVNILHRRYLALAGSKIRQGESPRVIYGRK